jgi:hypothetical protein
LEKLASIVGKTGKFFKMLGDDVHLEDGEWIGLDFSNGSLMFEAEYTRELPEADVRIFNEEFDGIRQGKFPGRASATTRSQYYSIAEPLDRDEKLQFGIYRPGHSEPEQFSISQAEATRLQLAEKTQEPVEGYGAIQGTIRSVFFGPDSHLHVRELSTGDLIRCTYQARDYEKIVRALQIQNAVLHIYGEQRLNLSTRKIERIAIDRIDIADSMSDSEFEEFFGCAPALTGDETTQQFIDRVRGHDEPA